MGVDFSSNEETKKRIDLIKMFAEGTPQPAIFAFDDLLPEYLQTASGESLEKHIHNGILVVDEYRYLKPVELDINKAELVDVSNLKGDI